MIKKHPAFIVLLATMTASCSDMRLGAEQIAECEQGVIYRLKSPSSYNAIKTDAFFTQVSVDEISNDFNIPGNSIEADEKGMTSLMYVRIEYDADNSFGAAMRGDESCNFIRNTSQKWQRVSRDYSAEIEQLEAEAIDGTKRAY